VSKYITAAKSHFETKKLEAEAVLSTYFNDAVGVGEHSDIPAEIYKWVENLATAEDSLEVLKRFPKELR
jgi:hypothetical protein|tara:strand:+ start:369 stop:575 length:207 start_codon:yes stop_codon:yes gene_type:complete